MSQTGSSQSQESERNLDLGLLVGLLLTDGSVRNQKRSQKVIFSNKSEILHELFRKLMGKLFNVQRFEERTDRLGVKSTIKTSKNIVEFLLTLTPSYRTKPYEDGTYPPTEIPKFIKQMSKEDLSKVLQIMFSCDGSVVLGVKWHKLKNHWVFTRRIQLTSVLPKVLNGLSKLLREKFQMRPKIWKNEIVLDRKHDILKFSKEIRFLDNVTISRKSRNWYGFEKNFVLDLVVKTFELRKTDLDRFQTREEVIEFLKSQIKSSGS
jgi:hypothetical protein